MFVRLLRPPVHTFGSSRKVSGGLSCGLSVSSYLHLPPKPFREFSSIMSPTEGPEWLQSLAQDQTEGLRLYKWTASDVVVRNDLPETGVQSCPASLSTVSRGGIKTSVSAIDRRRIYILGLGNIGRLFAASLARLPNPPPITLVVHRQSLLEHWATRPGLTVHPNTYLQGITTSQDDKLVDFEVERWAEEPPPSPGMAREIMDTNSCANSERLPANRPTIPNLIVTTKAQDALLQVDRLRRYLGPDSTVLFAQNGMNKLWPPYGDLYNTLRYGVPPESGGQIHNEQCPKWLSCVVNHGVFSRGPFESVHASPANIIVGAVGEGTNVTFAPADELYLVQQILASPDLNARFISRSELWVAQLEKLVVNSIINPLTAVLHCKNGELFVPDCCIGRTAGDDGGNILPRIIDQLLHEASNVLQSLVYYDPAVRGLLEPSFAVGGSHSNSNQSSDVDRLLERLSFATLRSMLYRVGHVVKDNTSSMLQDVRVGKATEIKELNGWFVNMADHLGNLGYGKPNVTAHRTLIALVENEVTLKPEQLHEHFRL